MYRFRVDAARLTFGDLLDMESGKMSVMASVMAKCLVNDAEQFYPDAEAVKIIRAIPLTDLNEIAEQFRLALDAYRESAIPPTGGGR